MILSYCFLPILETTVSKLTEAKIKYKYILALKRSKNDAQQKTHLHSFCIKTSFTYFFFQFVLADLFNNYFSPFLH